MAFLFGRRTAANRKIVDQVFERIVAARRPVFYETGGVADTFNGRFELLALHTTLVVRRLKVLGDPAPEVAQDIVDTLFRNLDPALRELGVGDMAVPKRMKKLAEGFLGRAIAYDAGLLDGGETLEVALSRNVYAGARSADALAEYCRAARQTLDAADLDALLHRPLPFPDAAAYFAQKAA